LPPALPTKRSAPRVQRRLSSREDRPPAAPRGPDQNAQRMRLWLYRKGHRCRKMHPQRLANRRLTPIKAAKERINRTAACVNVGAATGGKSGAATSVCDMMKTFNEFSFFWKMGERGDRSCRSAGVPLSDLRADVCSRRDTQPAQLQSIMGTRFCGKSGTGTRKQQMHRTALMRRAARIAPQVTGSNCRRTSPVLSASCGPFRSRRG
jgi:hypothetical protein